MASERSITTQTSLSKWKCRVAEKTSEHIVSQLDIVGSVYHLVIYMQSNKTHNVVLMSKFIQHYVSSTCFGPHRSIIRSVLYKLYLQICYVVLLCVLLDTSSRCNGRTCRAVRVLPHTKSANTACSKRS